jgi:cyclophilin family peptidyl-prolyl cis-trans isomerase
MAQLRYAQQKQRNQKRVRYGIAGIAVLAVVIAVLFAVILQPGKSNKTKTATKSSSTTAAASTTTVPGGTTTTAATIPPVSVPLLAAPASVGCPTIGGNNPHYTKFTKAPPMCIDPTKSYTATMVTDAGTITIKLLPNLAPVTVNNFVFLAEYHFYDGIAFHRVIPGFVDQGGDPTGTGQGGPGYTFKDELPKSASVYTNGALAMANSGANTNGSQFFFVSGTSGTKQLQPNYTYFGQVTGGLDVVTKINNDGTPSGAPKVLHKIVSVTITEGGASSSSTSAGSATTTTAPGATTTTSGGAARTSTTS